MLSTQIKKNRTEDERVLTSLKGVLIIFKFCLIRGEFNQRVMMFNQSINLRSKVNFCILVNGHICRPHNNLWYKNDNRLLICYHNNFQFIVKFLVIFINISKLIKIPYPLFQ